MTRHVNNKELNLIELLLMLCGSHDSSVGMSTGFVLDDREIGVQFMVGVRVFFLLHSIQAGSDPPKPPEIKRQESYFFERCEYKLE